MKEQKYAESSYVFWIDTKVYQNTNMNNLKAFNQMINKLQEKIIFQETNSIEVLKYQLSLIPKNSLVIVISSASLDIKWYNYMQEEQKITVICLFCLSEQGGNLLARKQERKIKQTLYSCEKVMKFVVNQIRTIK